ncbi:MAG TPA: branched-chain amino acid ABC transporter permease [Candidatus Binatia bacterium]|nr:branched-chain amino acid ABC transporter permease [Candidatus Binatia bacterium]
MLAQQFVNAISLGGLYALFALGFTLVFGVLNVVNLAHGAIFMLGAYVALQAVVYFHMPLLAAVLAAMLCTGLAGWILDKLVFAPLRARRAPHLAPMVATIGLGIVLTSAVEGFFGAQNLRFPVEALPADAVSLAGVRITWLELRIFFLALLLMGVLLWGLKKTRVGCALRGLAESPKAAAILGVNVDGLFRVTSVIAALLGGVSGVLIALYTNAVFPQMGQPMLHKGIAVVILGGMGDIRGALLGGFFLGFAEVFSVAYIGSTMRDAVAFGLLFIVLLLRPEGLFGQVPQRRA